ncbi:nuclear transport factor 2 family protein [Streptomyces mobaraensis NBRC 13819 = DSM 40847]|uniref:Uncharacterized protein n=1 Tax=Streptomyces mobaraensis (strain ATCC 29032 / DSM 40847 / JCM 4168 / NBRC 13819 / NCIMB 11159 / IPCR 16-22) TaxID=1223523 RepID=M3BM81_STRM1|nr:nuclear transport factor 2 family protein [Streptomyces mobaraensis]EMF00720.1 hypothetical protein H340_10195 [Streptomyces mobaraensis NBRC 13819 = DSM 40847]QTT72565.1 nuclear transport factor 2 family protein [Streptomyces mobaraensis NBRC 13819 = DSM 40847]
MSTATPATPTETTAATRTVVEELLRRMADGDPERIAELYADGADWAFDWPAEELGRGETPWIRERSSRADAAAHYREIGAHHVPEAADTRIERVLVDGTDAVVTGELRLMARPTGRRYRARFALHLTMEDGLVTRHHVYEDSLAVVRAFAG